MKRAILISWNILTIVMILTIFLGIAYYSFLSNRSSLIILGIVVLTIFIIPLFFKKRNRRKILSIENFIINGIFFLLLGVLIFKSPGRPKSFTNEKDNIIETSISKWEKIKIGGIDQWLLIKGENTNNPVILYLTGGYGQPSSYIIANKYPQLEKDFTVAYWEQRGSGKSYDENIPDSTINIKQLSSDINEIAKYLKNTFNQNKIILVGHSWGSIIGIAACKIFPDNFHFVLNVGQSVDFDMNLEEKYSQILKKAEQQENQGALRQLKEIGKPPYMQKDKWDIDESLDYWANYFSGSEYTENWVVRENLMLLFKCPEYTLKEKITLKSHNKILLAIDESMNTNFYDSAYIFSVPIYFVQGENDLNTTTSLVEKYYNKIVAPDKDMLVIKNTGHDAHFDKPNEFHEFLLSKL